MATPTRRPEEMLLAVAFICVIATIICITSAVNNIHLYGEYQQMQRDVEALSHMLECYVEKILSYEITNASQQPSSTSIESRFLISILHPLNQTKKYFELTSVPIVLFDSVVNHSYPCYVDPRNDERLPLKSVPDVAKARHDFLWRACFPAVIAAPGVVLLVVALVVALLERCQAVLATRPRGFFRVRTHPTSST